jgi:hypothetical protein
MSTDSSQTAVSDASSTDLGQTRMGQNEDSDDCSGEDQENLAMYLEFCPIVDQVIGWLGSDVSLFCFLAYLCLFCRDRGRSKGGYSRRDRLNYGFRSGRKRAAES